MDLLKGESDLNALGKHAHVGWRSVGFQIGQLHGARAARMRAPLDARIALDKSLRFCAR